jgi:hypothetical protein
MKRWRAAGAGLAVLVLLVLVARMGLGSGSTDPSREAGRQTAADTGQTAASDSRHRIPDFRRATIALPAIKPGHPAPLRLTRNTLEQAWQAGRLDVALPGGGRYAVVLEEQRFDPGGQWTVVGRVQTRLGPQAMVLTVGPEAVFGVLPRPDGSLLQVTTTRGKAEIAAAGGLLPPGRTSRLAAEPDYMIPAGQGGRTASASGATRMNAMPPSRTMRMAAAMPRNHATRIPEAVPVRAAATTEIVALGLYSDDLVALRGSVSAAETEMTNLFAITNQAHTDGATGVRFKVAGLKRIAVAPALTNQDALYAVTDNTIAGIDLFKLRDDMAADLIALVRPYHEGDPTCGIAWMNGGGRMPQNVQEYYGVSVSNVARCGPYVLPHEMGHNLGSAHDRETMTANGHLDYGVYEYSFGYRQDGPPAFATVMAYPEGNQPWLGYFSSPGSMSCGAACGVADFADNVRSLGTMAPVIAAFRSPPGTVSIVDAETYEADGPTAHLEFTVRLSGNAPAGGVWFDALVTARTAKAGVDYLVPTQTRSFIPEGQREAGVTVQLVGDTAKEADETIQVTLANVIGATVYDGEAVGRIVNDDPRLKLSGRVRFEGAPVPESPFWLDVNGLSSAFDSASLELTPPDFAYEVWVVKGATPTFFVDAPQPFAILPFKLGEVRTPQVRDIRLKKGLHVSGKVKLPAGQPALTELMWLDFRASIDGVQQMLPSSALEPPDFKYSQWVVPHTWVYMELTPPGPYQRFFANKPYARTDFVQDINLSPLPTLIIWGGDRIRVGQSEDWQLTMQLVVQLSVPAPAGGVHLHYRTVDGTATAGSDYVAMSGDLEIPEGEMVGYTKDLILLGDDEIEGNEDFQVVVSKVSGANPAVTSAAVILDEQNPPMSMPLPPSRKR